MKISTEEQEALWAEQIKYHAARYIWKKQDHVVPYRSKKQNWREWWESKYKESYIGYVEKMKQKKWA